jgi:hypothetical protein
MEDDDDDRKWEKEAERVMKHGAEECNNLTTL